MEIRLATIEDASSIRKIYGPYVQNTAVTFEYDIPSIQEFEYRIRQTLKEYPYLVAIQNNEVVGYCYAGAFHSRQAYKHSAELSIYLRQDVRGQGIGTFLYKKIEEMLLKQNIYLLHACIATSEVIDEYLNDDSPTFHKKMGFQLTGRHDRCGYKFGKWYSIIWMDKLIRERDDNPDDFIPFSECR